MKKEIAALISIISNSLLIFLKLFCGILTGSISIISEAIHSSMDLLASIIAYFSIKASLKEKDKCHPFGHEKFENLSGFAEANLIIFAAILIIIECCKKLIYGVSIEKINFGIAIMLITATINFIISIFLIKVSKKTNSIALEADGLHLLTDTVTSLGVFVGLILVKITGISIIDPITALIVSFIIIKTGISLIKKSSKDLVDSSLEDNELKKIINILNNYKSIEGFHNLRTRKCGNKSEIDFSLKLKGDISLLETHNLCNQIELEIKTKLPGANIVIHQEPSIK